MPLETLLYGWTALAAPIAVLLFFVDAPYGRHARPGWGPRIASTLGWVIMEAPAPIVFTVTCFAGERRHDPAALAFFAMWQLHYVHRAFVFPLRRRGGQRPMPVAIVLQGALFNCVNAWLCGHWLFSAGAPHPEGWLTDPRFLAGGALFLLGFAANLDADSTLIRLRRPGDTAYGVPAGGLFRYVSAPNYLGEIVEWCGFALATWRLAPAAFAIWTAANLVPRAIAHHRWYRARFADYPPGRKALIPFLL